MGTGCYSSSSKRSKRLCTCKHIFVQSKDNWPSSILCNSIPRRSLQKLLIQTAKWNIDSLKEDQTVKLSGFRALTIKMNTKLYYHWLIKNLTFHLHKRWERGSCSPRNVSCMLKYLWKLNRVLEVKSISLYKQILERLHQSIRPCKCSWRFTSRTYSVNSNLLKVWQGFPKTHKVALTTIRKEKLRPLSNFEVLEWALTWKARAKP